MLVSRRWFCCLLMSLAAVSACEKSADPTIASPPDYNPLAAMQLRHGVRPEFFTYNPRRIQRFVSQRGTAIETGAEAFVGPGGLELSAAPVRLEFREVIDKKDMLLSGIPGGTEELVLESGGHFYLQATQDNRPLGLVPRVRIGLASRAPARLSRLAGMRLFSVTGQLLPDPFRWKISTDGESTLDVGIRLAPDAPDYLLSVLNHKLYNESLGWFGYQRQLYTGTALTTVQVALAEPPAPGGPRHTLVYLVFTAYNAVAQLRSTGPAAFSLPNVPTGTEATVVVLQSVGGKLYLGQQTALLQPEQRFAPALAEMSEASIVAELSKF